MDPIIGFIKGYTRGSDYGSPGKPTWKASGLNLGSLQNTGAVHNATYKGLQDITYLDSQVAQNNRPLYPKVDHYWFKVAHNYEPLALQVVITKCFPAISILGYFGVWSRVPSGNPNKGYYRRVPGPPTYPK